MARAASAGNLGSRLRQFLQVAELAEVKNVLLNQPPAGDAPVFDDAEVAMPPAIVPPNLGAPEHDGSASFTDRPPRKRPWSAPQPFSARSDPTLKQINHLRNRGTSKIADARAESANFG